MSMNLNSTTILIFIKKKIFKSDRKKWQKMQQFLLGMLLNSNSEIINFGIFICTYAQLNSAMIWAWAYIFSSKHICPFCIAIYVV